MKDERKTKQQLVEELRDLRRRVAEFEGQEALREREESYRLMVRASPVPIV